MMASAKMGPNSVEILNNFCTQMNILLCNCRGGLDADFKRLAFETKLIGPPKNIYIDVNG